MTARDVTGFYACLSARKSGNFVRILGENSYEFTQKTGEKGKIGGENSKNSSGENSQNRRFLSCRGGACPENMSTTRILCSVAIVFFRERKISPKFF